MKSAAEESSSVGSGSGSAGLSTRNTSPHELHRTLTPASGIFAGSTGKEVEQDAQVMVMTIVDWVQVEVVA